MIVTPTMILLVAGMANLLVGALWGIPMGLQGASGANGVPKYLTMVHLAGLMHGPILISIAFAVSISTLSSWINTTAATMLALASALLIAKDTINWRQGVKDEFAEESIGLRIGWVFGPLHNLGLILATAGVLGGV